MLKYIYIAFALLIFTACEDDKPQKKKEINWTTEKSVDMHKQFSFEQEVEIKVFLKQHPELEMQRSETGLYYMLAKDSIGQNIQEDQVAKVHYLVKLLSGDTVYHSEGADGVRFKVDKSDVELGLHEGIKMMSVGDKAKFIMPSHLAHGLLGDMKEIPPLQSIFVEIELLSIK